MSQGKPEQKTEDPISPLNKGLGPMEGAVTPGAAVSLGWNLLREDLCLPAAILYRDRLLNNQQWMRRFIERYGAKLAPHGKTTMAPKLFDMQLQGGAWGITLATAHQTRVAYEHGVRRILMANQLIGRQNMAIISQLLRDPEFEFYCLVDSAEGVDSHWTLFFKILAESESSRHSRFGNSLPSYPNKKSIRAA